MLEAAPVDADRTAEPKLGRPRGPSRKSTWRQKQEMVIALLARLGDPAPAAEVMERVERCAEIKVIARRAREGLLCAEGGVTLNDVVRAEGAAARAEKALGLPKLGATKPLPLPAEYLAAKVAE